jgi:hypothetical protein
MFAGINLRPSTKVLTGTNARGPTAIVHRAAEHVEKTCRRNSEPLLCVSSWNGRRFSRIRLRQESVRC